MESNFCYLGDMLCAGGGCKLAIITRCSTAWGKFKRLLPILTSKHVSLRTCGKVFNACVRSALLHGSETLAPTAPDLQRLRGNDRSMVRWIWGVRDDDEVSADTLCAMLGVQKVSAALHTRRLRWYGHVARSSRCIKVSNGAKIRNRYNQVPHLTQDTNGKVTNSQKTPQTRAKRSALSQQVTTKHI